VFSQRVLNDENLQVESQSKVAEGSLDRGNGPYASVSVCPPGVTVILCSSIDEAERLKSGIDKCGVVAAAAICTGFGG
jgi:hypothetical protein